MISCLLFLPLQTWQIFISNLAVGPEHTSHILLDQLARFLFLLLTVVEQLLLQNFLLRTLDVRFPGVGKRQEPQH